MSDDRCRACGAALPAEAGWCTLCFTEVRQPAPIEAPVLESVTVPAADALAAPIPAMATADAVAADATGTADGVVPPVIKPSRHRAEATWPCPQCEARVPMSLDACEACGAPFLSGAVTSVSTRLPVVGDVGAMTNGQRLLVAAGISGVMVVLFVFVFFIGGTIF